jgi:putative DNA primase/helicase
MESKIREVVDVVLGGIDRDEVLRKAGVIDLDTSKPLAIGSDVEIAQRMAAKLRAWFGGHVVYSEGSFYGYNGKCWEAMQDNQLRIYVHRWDGASVNQASPVRLGRTRINSILGELAAILTERDWFVKPRIGINCQNGFVDMVSGVSVLIPHHPALRQRHVIEGEWHGPQSLEGSLLERLLTGCFLDDGDAREKIDLIGEVLGVSAIGCATRLRQPKALVLVGPEAENGKSKILELMRGALPSTAVCTVPPTRFGDEKYVIRIAGKLLNTSDELGTVGAITADVFKRMVTGEPVEGRDLYSSVVFFRPGAQHVFACNELPSFKGGMDRGVLRRLGVVPFNRRIPDDEQVLDIAARIIAEEMPLLLSLLVMGAARAISRGTLTEPPSSKGALEEWAQISDPVRGWIDERVLTTGGHFETRTGFKDFLEWARLYGYRDLPSINSFSGRLKGAGLKYKHSGAFKGFVGARLRAIYELEG